MKKTIAVILALALALLICPAAMAVMDVQIATSPQVLTAPGYVTMTFRVTNTSANSMENISISGYGISGSNDLTPGPITPQQALQFSLRNIEVVAGMVGQPLQYTLAWTENGNAMSQNVSVSLGETAAAADMTGKAKASKASGSEGDKVTITYSLSNPSSTPMTNVILKDAIAGDKDIAGAATIAAGETKEFTYEYTLGSSNAESAATVNYQVNGESRSLTLDKLTLSVLSIKLDTTVTQGETTPEGTPFTIVLKNNGNQSISKIQVTDEMGHKVNAEAFSLSAGKEKTLEYTVVTESLRNVAFTITGTDEQEQPYENKTKSYTVTPYIDPSTISISMLTSTVQPLSDSGRITVKFVITNNSAVEMSDAVITETEYGVVEAVGALAVGDTSVEKELIIGAPRELEFTLTAADPSGAAHTYVSKLNADYVTLSTEPPAEATPVPETTQEPVQQAGAISDTLLTVLVVLAVLMAIAGVALLVLSVYEKRSNRHGLLDEEDEEDSFLEDDEEQTAPIPQARPAKKAAEQAPAAKKASRQAHERQVQQQKPVTPREERKPQPRSHAQERQKPVAQQPAQPRQKPVASRPVRQNPQPNYPQATQQGYQRQAQQQPVVPQQPTAPQKPVIPQVPVAPIPGYGVPVQPPQPQQTQQGYANQMQNAATQQPAAPQQGYGAAPVRPQQGYPQQQPAQTAQPVQTQQGYVQRPVQPQQGYPAQPPVQQQPGYAPQAEPVRQQTPVQKAPAPQEIQATRSANRTQIRRIRPVDQDDD